MTVRLRPLRDDETRDFLDALHDEYVEELVEDASLSREEAEEKADTDHAALFPGGNPQQDHHMYVVERETGEPVGHLFWAKRQSPGSASRAFLYQIYIAEPFRGRGLGRQAMELLEAEVRTEGLPGIDLNVWGGNDLARSLYRKLGFEERAVFMSKELG
jgi:ribosomal protein S18 acetylase RimI-like enzyme